MCGICGAVGFETKETAEAAVRRMMAAMRHRGPDDEGLHVGSSVAIGMRRLSIIDLAGGHQPVFNEDGTIAVVCNGEIYNFRDLRRQLEALGHVFRTRSDTEVVVHAYEQWGADCVCRLRGMFALAIHEVPDRTDGKSERLFLARDRLGIKPLYYTCVDGTVLFASEVRALLATGRVPRRLSLTALDGYLLFGSVGEPMTLVEGVYSLPPGHRILLDAQRQPREVCPEPYWDFPASATGTSAAGITDRRKALDQLRPLLEEAVRLHLFADVPVGIFLSGGIDSTALAALASREQSGVRTFTVVFPEEEFSEAELARRTAKKFGTDHQELLLSGEEMLGRMDDAVAALDQPSMDGINTYFVSGAVQQAGLKVALSGLGGDEVFGGYPTFRLTPRLQKLAALAGWVPRPLRSWGAALASRWGEHHGRADAARKLAALWREPAQLPHPYFYLRLLFTPEQVTTLRAGKPESDYDLGWRRWLAQSGAAAESLDSFTAVSLLEARSYLVNTLLRDTDAVSMAHSLEVRVPFLDHSVVEFVAKLPPSLKRLRKTPKALLVDALRDLLPSEVISQPKRTFTFPWERWLRGALCEQVAAGITHVPDGLRPLVSTDAFQSVWQAFLEGRTGWARPWSLYVLNQWVRHNIEES
jgi:asparagine synthase (glutamine-hydrolysing)